MIACKFSNISLIFVFSAGFLFATPVFSRTSLMKAASENDAEAIRKYARYGGDVNRIGYFRSDKVTAFGFSPLHIAAINGNEAAVKALLEAKADRSLTVNVDDYTLNRALGHSRIYARLMATPQSKPKEIPDLFSMAIKGDVKGMANRKEEIEDEEKMKRTALGLAISKNHTGIADILKKAK